MNSVIRATLSQAGCDTSPGKDNSIEAESRSFGEVAVGGA